jgi:hypothetical protein
MKLFRVVATALTGMSSLCAATTTSPQTTLDTSSPGAHPVTNTVAAAFTPGLDDLMTMLIQPRHVKLYYAGMRKNWELAAFESRELNAALRRIGQAIPRYRDNGVDETVASMIAPAIGSMDAAVAAGDSKQFIKAYAELTSACNACHTYMEHPFLVMRVPEADAKHSAYPDQDFSAAGSKP